MEEGRSGAPLCWRERSHTGFTDIHIPSELLIWQKVFFEYSLQKQTKQQQQNNPSENHSVKSHNSFKILEASLFYSEKKALGVFLAYISMNLMFSSGNL